jgi:hypothetical protein
VQHLRDPAVVRVGRLLLQRVHHITTGLGPDVPSHEATRASVNPKVFLCCYMIRYHADKVFARNPDQIAHELMTATAALLPAFDLIVAALDGTAKLPFAKPDVASAAKEFPWLVT